MSKLEFDEDNTWLKEMMLKESEHIEVPASLEPEAIRKKLEGVEQKHINLDWKRSVMVAASFVIVAGASLQAGKMLERGKSSTFSNVPVEVTESAGQEKADDKNEVKESAKPKKEPQGSAGSQKKPTGNKSPQSHNAGQAGHITADTNKADNVKVSETRAFKEGDGKKTVTDGDIIYSGEGKDIVIQKYTDSQVKEVNRMSVNKDAEEFYIVSDQLVCITSDTQDGTTVFTYDVDEDTQLQEKTAVSVEGGYQCSYQEGNELYVFTDTGNVQQINVTDGQTNTFSVDEKDAKYFVSGQSLYTLSKNDAGTSIQSYRLEGDSLQKGESTVCNERLDDILAIQGEGSKLELLSAQKDGISYLQFDDQMRLVDEKKNEMGDQVFAGDFTENGILVFGNDSSKVQLSMLHQDSLETKNTVSIEDVSSVSIGDLSLKENGSLYGFAASTAESKESTYYVYNYNDSKGFEETKAQQVDADKVENEFVIGDTVLVADAGGVDVLVE